MIIELFGPPGAGKTTFAHALAKELRNLGRPVTLVISYRPAEHRSCPDPLAAAPSHHLTANAIRRLSRPVIEMLTLARHPFANSHDIAIAANLVRALPPRSLLWSIRMTQYISRLSHSWSQARTAGGIVLFDQAYIQAVYSLAVFSETEDEMVLARALELAPRSDLSVRLDAPHDVLRTRLHKRRSLQGPLERLFELDLDRNLKSVDIIDRLHLLLSQLARPVACASSLDRSSLQECSARIARKLSEEFSERLQDRGMSDGQETRPQRAGSQPALGEISSGWVNPPGTSPADGCPYA